MKVLELVRFHLTKEEIDFYLSGLGIEVVGSRMTEEGYDLVLECEDYELGELAVELEDLMEVL